MTDDQDEPKRWPLDLEVHVPVQARDGIEISTGTKVFIFGIEVYGVISLRYETIRAAQEPTRTKITLEVTGDPIRVTQADEAPTAKPDAA